MFGRLFDNPVMVLVLLVIILLLFGAPKLPGMARSLGQSLRIFKSEISEMKNDGNKDQNRSQTVVNGEVVDRESTAAPENGSTAQNGTVQNGEQPQANPGPAPDQTNRPQN